jgi:hypothetical protein
VEMTWVLILARELDLQNEFEEIDIQNLIPEHLREGSADFLTKLKEFDAIYDKIKVIKTKSCAALHWRVIRDLQHDKGILEVKLVSVPSTLLWVG